MDKTEHEYINSRYDEYGILHERMIIKAEDEIKNITFDHRVMRHWLLGGKFGMWQGYFEPTTLNRVFIRT